MCHTYINTYDFHKDSFTKFVLVGDIGGTNTDLAIFGLDKEDKIQPIAKDTFLTKKVTDITVQINDLLKTIKGSHDIEVEIACLGIAGPLQDDRNLGRVSHAPNMIIKKDDLLNNTLLKKVIILNDFEAIGFSIEVLPDGRIKVLRDTDSDSTNEPKAVIGAGTSLGECILIYNRPSDSYIPIQAEGGDCDFAPRNDVQRALAQFIEEYGNSPTVWSDVLSGKGILNIFKFITHTHAVDPTEELISELESSDDKSKTIAEFAKEGEPSCRKTMDLFFELYGQYSANMMLKVKAIGGVYVAGELAIEDIYAETKDFFINGFESVCKDKTNSDIWLKTKLYELTTDDAGLYGAANAAANHEDLF